ARRPHRTGVSLGEREQVQAMLGQSAMELFAARAAVYAAARAAEAGDGAEVEVAMAKAVATEAVAHIVDRAMQLSGGAAVVEGHPLGGSTVASDRGASPKAPPRPCGSPWRAGCSLPRPRRKEIERMRPNRLRELLRAGQPTLGTHIHAAWPATIELVG